MIDNPHYLYRMTVLVAIASLAPAVPHDCLCHNMLPVMMACARDKVRDACPSGCCKCLSRARPVGDEDSVMV